MGTPGAAITRGHQQSRRRLDLRKRGLVASSEPTTPASPCPTSAIVSLQCPMACQTSSELSSFSNGPCGRVCHIRLPFEQRHVGPIIVKHALERAPSVSYTSIVQQSNCTIGLSFHVSHSFNYLPHCWRELGRCISSISLHDGNSEICLFNLLIFTSDSA